MSQSLTRKEYLEARRLYRDNGRYSLLCMAIDTPAYRNLIRNIGAAGFAHAESIGDIKRIVLGYLVSH